MARLIVGERTAALSLELELAKAKQRAIKRHRQTLGESAAKMALKAVGVPNRWGGTSPRSGFDCSGLVYSAYGRLGIELPHSPYALYGRGQRVARSRLKAGDVLFFSGLGHVGLYVGRGRMVHAPRSGRRVEVVSSAGRSTGVGSSAPDASFPPDWFRSRQLSAGPTSLDFFAGDGRVIRNSFGFGPGLS